ncbi:hypothetical protein B0T16DRAFT_12554 [Cercophora newfieldiana]|uniref:Uncharacterized protein n=1 Tax=Cercophora newfieldiana TaxID=92897 RepID=A0AA39YMU1_9PEZI|nr:hypothetical protein B0T16DRAFT_12554 [Cercophora newfieldiana]
MRQLSISQIISTHPRERLYTHPLVWTARHLGLLSCEFFNDGTITLIPPNVPASPQEQPNTNVLPAPTTLPTKNYPSAPNNVLDLDNEWRHYFMQLRSDTNAARSLATCRNSISKQRALSQLLGLEPCSDKVHFQFARRTVADLPCCSFSRTPPLAQLGYINLSDMAWHRRNKLSGLGVGCKHRRPNPPGTRVINKQLRRITPDDPREDPYIAALLIALAQKQRVHLGDDNSGSQVLLLATLLGDEWLYIYTSMVSLEFLDGLDNPSRLPPAGAQSRLGMAIHRRRLAFQPYETLPRRLAVVVRDAGLAREYGSADLDKPQTEAVAEQASGS